MRQCADRGRNGSQRHPEKRPRGDSHWSRRSPEKLSRVSGEEHSQCRYSDETVRQIFTSSGTHREIAQRFGCSQSQVSLIKNRKARSSATEGL